MRSFQERKHAVAYCTARGFCYGGIFGFGGGQLLKFQAGQTIRSASSSLLFGNGVVHTPIPHEDACSAQTTTSNVCNFLEIRSEAIALSYKLSLFFLLFCVLGGAFLGFCYGMNVRVLNVGDRVNAELPKETATGKSSAVSVSSGTLTSTAVQQKILATDTETQTLEESKNSSSSDDELRIVMDRS